MIAALLPLVTLSGRTANVPCVVVAIDEDGFVIVSFAGVRQTVRAFDLLSADGSGPFDTTAAIKLLAREKAKPIARARIILRQEFAKQPATLPMACVLYLLDDEYIVHWEYRQESGEYEGKWARDNGAYCTNYEEAFDEYRRRVDQRIRWYRYPENLERIERFIDHKMMGAAS